LATHYLLPILLASGGGAKATVAISGTGAWVTDGFVAHAAHCVSKLAQARLVEHMAKAFIEEGVLVVAVHAGCVWTNTRKPRSKYFISVSFTTSAVCRSPMDISC